MTFYYIFFASLLALMTYGLNFKKFINVFVIIFISISLFFVGIKGLVGTDTSSYLDIISKINNNGNYPGIEIGFIFLVKFLLLFVDSNYFILAILASIISIILLAASQAAYRSSLVFLLCIIPVFFLQMTMNGLRFGLAFAITMFTFRMFFEDKLKLALFFSFFATSIHSSALIIFVVGLVLADDKYEFVSWLKVNCVALIAFILHVVLQVSNALPTSNAFASSDSLPILDKFYYYLSFYSPHWYSGISIFTLSLVSLYAISSINKDKLIQERVIVTLLIIVILTFIAAKLSYAGLRLQASVLFAIFLTMQFKPSFESIVKSKKYLFLIGCLGILFFCNNAIQTKGQGSSPFIPYYVNPDITNKYMTIKSKSL